MSWKVTITKKGVDKLYEAAEEIRDRRINYAGCRVLTEDQEDAEEGDTLRESYCWDEEYDCSTYNTDEEQTLDGAACVEAEVTYCDSTEEALEQLVARTKEALQHYSGRKVAILAGRLARYGSDEHEIDIIDAEVIRVLDADDIRKEWI